MESNGHYMQMAANLTDDEAEAIIRTHTAKDAWVLLKKMIFTDRQPASSATYSQVDYTRPIDDD